MLNLSQIDMRLAPMAGFTSAPMRIMSLRFGATAVYTEMAGVEGLVHEKTDETWQLLETLPEEHGHVYAQLYGSDPEHFARAAERVAATGRFIGIDINAGCPVPKVTVGGAGSALMREPDKIGEIVKATRSASGLPVSVKTRIGFCQEEQTVFRVLDAVQAAGGSELTLHGRYKPQGHAGEVHFDIVSEVRKKSSIPIIGNGGIRDAGQAAEFLERTGVDGIMIGQAAIGHPWVFQEVTEGRSFEPSAGHASYLSLDEIRKQLFTHLELEHSFAKHICEKFPLSAPLYSPEDVAVIRFRMHIFRYVAGLRGSSYMRGRMATLMTLDDCRRAVEGCLECERRFRVRRGLNS